MATSIFFPFTTMVLPLKAAPIVFKSRNLMMSAKYRIHLIYNIYEMFISRFTKRSSIDTLGRAITSEKQK